MLLRRRAVLTGLLVAAAAAGCGAPSGSAPGDTPRTITSHEAQLMAISRYKIYQRGRIAATLDFPGSVTYHADVVLDLRAHVGWGEFATTIDGKPAESGSLAWNAVKVFTAPTRPDADGSVPEINAWFGRAIDTTSGLDNFLLTVLALGADRPENPQLLRQSSVQAMRTDRVGDVYVTVFTGPTASNAGKTGTAKTGTAKTGTAKTNAAATASRLRFWVDGEGGIRRFQAYYGSPGDPPAQLTVADRGTVPTMPATIGKLFTMGQKQ